MKFIEANSILYRHQYGFMAIPCTIHPVLHLLNRCAEANNATPSQTLSSLYALNKAFNSISPNIQPSKLNTYGICWVANKWIGSYLANRTQFVDIDSNISARLSVRCDVPQSSIIGPLSHLSHSTTWEIFCHLRMILSSSCRTLIEHVFIAELIHPWMPF